MIVECLYQFRTSALFMIFKGRISCMLSFSPFFFYSLFPFYSSPSSFFTCLFSLFFIQVYFIFFTPTFATLLCLSLQSLPKFLRYSRSYFRTVISNPNDGASMESVHEINWISILVPILVIWYSKHLATDTPVSRSKTTP